MKSMNAVATLTLGLWLLAQNAGAQQSATDAAKDTARWTIGATQFRAGSMQLGLGRLNADLAAKGRPTFSNALPTFGVSTYARRGRLIGGASIDGSLPHRTADESWTTKLSVRTATLDGGYVTLDGARLTVNTVASIGLQSTWLHFERRGDFTYNDGLEDPARGVDLMSRGGIAQIGLSAEWRLESRRTGMFSIVGQAGRTQPLGTTSTFAGENHVRQTPKQDGGSYLRIAFSKPIAHGRRALDTVSGAFLSMLFQ